MKRSGRSASDKPGTSKAVDEARLKILQMLDEGKINAEQAAKLLEAIEPKVPAVPPVPPVPPVPSVVGYEEDVDTEAFDEGGKLARTFPAEGLREVKVKNFNGRISVAGCDESEVQVAATSGKGAHGVSFKVEDGVLTIKPAGRFHHRYHHHRGFAFPFVHIAGFGKGPRVSIDVRMPRTLAAKLSNVNGSILVGGLANATKASTTNGSVRCSGMAGELKATTTNGTIDARGLDTLETTVKTVNGSAVVAMNSCPDGECTAKSVNGSVSVYLPEDPSIRVDAKTVSGSVRSDFEIQAHAKSRRKLEGTLGGGSLMLTLKTVNGAINLRRLDDLPQEAEEEGEEEFENGDDLDIGMHVGGFGVCIDRDEIKEHIRDAQAQARQAVMMAREQIKQAQEQVAESLRELREDED